MTAIANSLKRDIASTYKTAAKGNMYNQLLYVNLLMYAFADEVQWPELFVKASVYLKIVSLRLVHTGFTVSYSCMLRMLWEIGFGLTILCASRLWRTL